MAAMPAAEFVGVTKDDPLASLAIGAVVLALAAYKFVNENY